MYYLSVAFLEVYEDCYPMEVEQHPQPTQLQGKISFHQSLDMHNHQNTKRFVQNKFRFPTKHNTKCVWTTKFKVSQYQTKTIHTIPEALKHISNPTFPL
jgi:hypothetical protein